MVAYNHSKLQFQGLTHSSGLQSQHTHIRCTCIHSGKTLIHIKLIIFEKKRTAAATKSLPGIRKLGPIRRMGNEREEMKIR
jgi:NAD(P)-dependent dehydrogenase (short-subunit alcohol dehydrogenase family)